jgi:hypothetical protein
LNGRVRGSEQAAGAILDDESSGEEPLADIDDTVFQLRAAGGSIT